MSRASEQSLDGDTVTRGSSKGAGTAAAFGAGALERLKIDTHLLILSLFSIAASLAIAPFSVHRLVQGEFALALVDGLLVAAMLGNLAYAWKSGRSVLAGNLIAVLKPPKTTRSGPLWC